MVNPINTHPHAVMLNPSYLEFTTYIPRDKTSSPLNRLANRSTSHKLRVLKLRIGYTAYAWTGISLRFYV